MTKNTRNKLPTTYDNYIAIEKFPKQRQVHSSDSSVWRDIGLLGIKVAAISIAFVLIFTFFYGFHRNIDPGMNPAIKDGDLILFYRLSGDYTSGDLVLLDFEGERQVRRVVAIAGDVVDINEQGLVINGSIQQEHDIIGETHRYLDGITFPITVGDGQVFVLGDARENAADSRIYGPVDTKNIRGRVMTVIRRRNL